MVKKAKTLSDVYKSEIKESSRFFVLKPWKDVLLDFLYMFILNTVLIYGLVWITHDSSTAMFSIVFCVILSIRGGLVPGLLSAFLMFVSDAIAMNCPPHNTVPMRYLFNNAIPGFVIGFSQSLITSLIIGYISSLVHRLRDEVKFRKKIQQDLEQKVAELDAFGHTLAHDLKNPLMIINVSSLALSKDIERITDATVHKKLSFISDSSEHMVNIIESILLLAGLKKINPQHFSKFSIAYCIEEALARMRYNIESSGATVIQPDTWPTVFGYPRWITEVWVNYINNALKYGFNPESKDSLRIELGYNHFGSTDSKNDKYIRFWVKDFGDGIPDEKKPILFQEFTRLHTSQSQGYGLGLSIVKSIISRSGGEVGVESEQGKGSLFYFTLPTSSDGLNLKEMTN